MAKPINILILEDNPADIELMERELRRSGLDYIDQTAQDKKTFLQTLDNFVPDLILADYALPGFDGLAAMAIARKRFADIPVIIVSGVISEETAIETLKAGASNYVLKHRLIRLRAAVPRALAEADQLTRRKRAEEALKESEHRLKVLLETVPIGISTTTPAGEIIEANPAMVNMFGWDSREEFSKIPISALYCEPEDRWRFLTLIQKGAVKDFQACFKRRDGTIFWGALSSRLVTAPDRETLFINALQDITERKRAADILEEDKGILERMVVARNQDLTDANAQLRQSNEILGKIFAGTHFSIVYLDDKFNFIKVNDAYARVEGHSPDFFRGKNHFELYPHKENEAIFKKVVETGEPFTAYAKPFVFPAHSEWGTTYWDWSLHPVKNAQGKVEGLIFSLVDVTRRALAEEEVRKTHIELQQSRRLSDIGQLAATVAHELRNPLAAIKITSANIQRKVKNPEIDRLIPNIDNKIDESDQIINNLLFYSRIRPPHFESINIYDIISESAEFAQKHCKKEISFTKRTEALKGILVDADPVQIKEVFHNILNNACDAVTDTNGRIEITSHTEDGFLKIAVSDNGEGIGPDVLAKVFDPFFTTKAKGTGLGLAVCRQIVNLHDGSIDIESQAGLGTTVNVNLPKKNN